LLIISSTDYPSKIRGSHMEVLPSIFVEREPKNQAIIELTKQKTPISLTSEK
jgi:hypothetical protein